MANKKSRKSGKSLTLLLVLLLAAAVLAVLVFAGLIPGLSFSFMDGEPVESATETATDAPMLPAQSETETQKPPVIVPEGGSLEIHFPELGNSHAGDCIYIKAGDNDILIDGGSTYSSVKTIQDYLSDYVTDGVLEYVIVTHAHEDHYACFAGSSTYDSLFDLYKCETIIDFAQTTAATKERKIYQNYQKQLAEAIEEGATHYTAAECITEGHSEFDLGYGITLTILDSYYYYNVSKSENDHSVCSMITYGEDSFLFLGDLEGDTATNNSKAEQYLIEMNDLPEVTLYKASHHGSNTSSSEALLSVIRPEIVVFPCVAGSPEYTKVNENMFPTQQTINTVSVYTAQVYVTSLYDENAPGKVTSMNGNIVIRSDGVNVTVNCSASDTLLRDTDWFRENRDCPDAWK